MGWDRACGRVLNGCSAVSVGSAEPPLIRLQLLTAGRGGTTTRESAPDPAEETLHAAVRQTSDRSRTPAYRPRSRRRPDPRLLRRPEPHARPSRRPTPVPGTARRRVLDRERVLPRERGRRREHRHPLVLRLRRPAVAARRPRFGPADLPRHAELGGRVRHRLPDPDLRRRDQLDHRLLHHHRHRRHPEPHRHRQRPLRPRLRHRPRHPMGLLPLGVPGLRPRQHHPARLLLGQHH